MKVLKLIAIPIFIMLVFFSCKKINDDTIALEPENVYSIKNNLLTFNSFSSYQAAVENKNNEQDKLYRKIKSESFTELKSKPQITNVSNNISNSNSISQIVNSFDSSLYTNYLLEILNTDKIFSINGFLIKVDMDNNFCSFIDLITNPNGYQDLNSNNFNNTNIHLFLDVNEPVLLVLEKIRNNEITWEGYQTELAGKVNNPGGICFRSGAKAERKTQLIPSNQISGYGFGDIISAVEYKSNFLSFTLKWESRIRGNGGFPPPTLCNKNVSFRVLYSYDFEGACYGSGNGAFAVDNRKQDCSIFDVTIYQAGSALRTRRIVLYTFARWGPYSPFYYDYPQTNYLTPLKLGY
jgi:hypothetical protein